MRASRDDTPERTPPPWRLLGRFRRSERGATAVEFALVIGPFLFALFATLEIAMVFWKTQVLETAVANASRQIYTGQFQNAAGTKTNTQLLTSFKTKVCENITALFDCQADIKVDVSRADTFAGVQAPNLAPNGVFDTSSFSYNKIEPGSIGVVTVAAEYKSFFPALSGSQLKNGNRLMIATSVFRAEPYSAN